MAAISSIVINDGQTTPVARTFVPVDHSNNIFIYRQNSSALAKIGQNLIHLKLVASGKNKDIDRVQVSVYLPVLEAVVAQNTEGYTAAPKLAYFLSSKMEFMLPGRATLAQRNDLLAFTQNVLSNVQVTDAVQSLLLPY